MKNTLKASLVAFSLISTAQADEEQWWVARVIFVNGNYMNVATFHYSGPDSGNVNRINCELFVEAHKKTESSRRFIHACFIASNSK
jgi:hypothetical protein